jgi:4-amino-4-deoxy-L-arabinose transferase-like glycosyltransferase
VAIFGLRGFGWRVFNVILGTLSVALMFVLAYLVTKNRKLSYFASMLLALDTLFFVHSSAALIDVPVVFFSLLGFIFYFWKASYWKIDHLLVAGIFFGLAALAKETGVFLLAAVVTYDILFGEGGWRPGVVRSVLMIAPAVLVFLLGVQIYDSLFTSASMPYFYQQISYMLSYGASLGSGSCPLCGWTDATLHSYITPLNWITFYSPVSYLVTSVTVSVGTQSYQYVAVGYYGISNVVIVWMLFVWLPLVTYKAYKARGKGEPSPDDKFAYFSAVWFLWTYVPYLILWLYGRVTYPFYLVTAIPALVAGTAYFITRSWFSYKLALVYVLFAFFLFLLYFPVKDFLPVTLRVLLGR